MSEQQQETQQVPDLDLRVQQYLALRNKKKEVKKAHDEIMAKYDEVLDGLESFIMQWLQKMNAQHIATESGTAYLATRVSATVADPEAFWTHVRDNKLWDLIDKRANAPACTEYVEKNGQAPPGVNYRTMLTVNVRQK